MNFNATHFARSCRSARTRAMLLLMLAWALSSCGDTFDLTPGGGGDNVTVKEACEAWCTDESCRSIHFTDDFDECMLGCTTEQHTSPCDGSYAPYISCLAKSGCTAQCTSDALTWAQCESGSSGELPGGLPGGGGGGVETLGQACKRVCSTAGCENEFFGEETQCLINCNRTLGGCDDRQADWIGCKADNACSDPCRDEAVAFAECSAR